jgi:hypothetical protein
MFVRNVKRASSGTSCRIRRLSGLNSLHSTNLHVDGKVINTANRLYHCVLLLSNIDTLIHLYVFRRSTVITQFAILPYSSNDCQGSKSVITLAYFLALMIYCSALCTHLEITLTVPTPTFLGTILLGFLERWLIKCETKLGNNLPARFQATATVKLRPLLFWDVNVAYVGSWQTNVNLRRVE